MVLFRLVTLAIGFSLASPAFFMGFSTYRHGGSLFIVLGYLLVGLAVVILPEIIFKGAVGELKDMYKRYLGLLRPF